MTVTKYDPDQVVRQAIEEITREGHETLTALARGMEIARSTLQRILQEKGLDLNALMVLANESQESAEDIKVLHQQIKHYRKLAERYEKKLTGRRWLREEVAGQMAVLKPVAIPRIKTQSKLSMSEQVGVLLYGDAHFGLSVPPGQLGDFGTYSSALAEERTIATFRRFAHLIHMRPFPVKKIKVYFLGDNVEHSHMRPAQAKQVDAHVVAQTIHCSNVLSHCLRFLCEEFEKVEVEAVPGNHGRTTQKAGENLPDETFDHLVYHIVKTALSDQPNFNINIHEAWYFVDEIFTWKFLALHGEDVLSWAGVPFYGIERAVKDYYMMLGKVSLETIREMDPVTTMAVDQFLSLLKLPDYVAIGHFHNKMMWDIIGVEVLANGTLSGVSIYGAKRRRKLSRPGQYMFTVHPEHGVAERCPINP